MGHLEDVVVVVAVDVIDVVVVDGVDVVEVLLLKRPVFFSLSLSLSLSRE
jgi:hypothetical protein